MPAADVDRETAVALSNVLRERRKKLGLTQEQLADLAEMDAKYYQSLENGRNNSKPDSLANPSLKILRKLAGAYGTTVPDLMWDVFERSEDSPEP